MYGKTPKYECEVCEFFDKVEKKKLTQAYDKGFRYGCMTTNNRESINGVFKRACMLPISTLVQLTFYKCVAYFERHIVATKCKLRKGEMYTSYAKNKISIWEVKASEHSVTVFHQANEVVEVTTIVHGFHIDKGNNKQIVKLKKGTCTYNKWQSFGLSCSHVLVVRAYAIRGFLL